VGVLVALSLALLMVGCGDSGDSARGERDDASSTTSPDAAAAYVGLSERAAIAKAEADGRPWRIGREDDEHFALTQDFVDDRVTFEIDEGKVTSATLG
jgi:hypothetical protein